MQFKKTTQRTFRGWKLLISFLFFTFSFATFSYGQCAMSCDDEIQVSLNQECEAEITYRMILRDPDNNYVCSPNGPRAYKVVVMDEDGVTIPTSPVITCEYAGRTLLVKVKHWYSGNSCWSKVIVEDKIAPVISDCHPVTVWCAENALPTTDGGNAPVPTITDACAEVCQTMQMTYVDSDTIIYTCEDEAFQNGITARFTRTWTACDNLGNCRSCTQPITVRVPNFEDIDFPPSLTGEDALECDACDLTDLTCTGMPTLHHESLSNSLCHLDRTYADSIVNSNCEGTHTIQRNWTIRNTCTNATHFYTQLIEIVDRTPPSISCTESPMVVQADPSPYACTASVRIPAADISDNCSSLDRIQVITKIYQIDSTGNRRVVERRENANGGFMLDLMFGQYEVYYQATDDCGNVSNNLDAACSFEIKDEIAPTPVCNALTKLTLDRDGKGLIFAESFDSGSYDNCCIDKYEVRRMGATEYMDYVEFTCVDAGTDTILLVQLRVTDCYGNSAICMIQVLVDDKAPPVITSCADDFEVTCSQGLTIAQIQDSLLSPPTAADACVGGIESVVSVKHDFRNECGIGAVIFEWAVYDAAGNGPVTCEQLVSFIDDTPISVTFPADYVDTVCVINRAQLAPAITGVPIVHGLDCESVEVLSSDSVADTLSSCRTFTRTWVVTNLCDEGNSITHTQTIEIRDVEAPVIDCKGTYFDICLDGGTCKRSFEVPGVEVSDCSKAIAVRAEWTFIPADRCEGDTLSGMVADARNGFMTQEFGLGQLWVDFYATDDCGNESTCFRDYTITDCEAPEIICLPGITLNVDEKGIAEVWANDFHQEIIDNCDDCPAWEYIFSFAQDTSDQVRFYDCTDLGLKTVQVWVTDPYGNQNYCPVSFVIKGAIVCDSLGMDTTTTVVVDGMAGISGRIFKESGEMIEAVEVNAENHFAENMDVSVTNVAGTYDFEFQRSTNVHIKPNKNDDPRNGVTTFDILLLRKHILGYAELDSPYKLIAADVNHSNSITTADIIALRKIILEIDNDFPNNTSWRFIKADYQFKNPTNPFEEAMPESAIIPELRNSMEVDFIGIKVGDLSGNASSKKQLIANERTGRTTVAELAVSENQLLSNKVQTLNFTLQQSDIQAVQFALQFDPKQVAIVDIPFTNQMSKANFGTQHLDRGVLTLSWESPTNTNELFNFQLMVRSKNKALGKDLFTINSNVIPAVAYDENGNDFPVTLTTLDNAYAYVLFQNQPNPFHQTTTVRFSLPEKSQGKLTILDIKGQTLKTVEQSFEKGMNAILMDDLPQSGLLYYQLETKFGTVVRKMLQIE